MLEKNIANDVIQAGLEAGADFCDIFVEKTTTQTVNFKSQTVKDIKSGIDFGIGVRLIFGEQALYAYTNSKKLDDLISMTRNLAGYYKRDQIINPGVLDFSNAVAYKSIKTIGDTDVDLDHKISILKKLDTLTRSESDKISQVSLSL